MTSDTAGSFRLFHAFGIDVFVHWTWFILVVLVYQFPLWFDHPLWNLAILVTLFAIVTLHEFGHALACRSVGGHANRIVLWPLGGVAFVRPPERPGAMLWTIVAGPLVNVLLVPITLVICAVMGVSLLSTAPRESDLETFIASVTGMNLALLLFNMLPIYPLDGGQTFQALLWFIVGRVRSLQIAATTGLVLAVLGGFAAFTLLGGRQGVWLTLIAVFVAMEAFNGLRMARVLAAQGAERI